MTYQIIPFSDIWIISEIKIITTMKNFHPFFVFGSTGVIVTAILHILLGFILKVDSVHGAFFTIYSTFVTFMFLGFALTLKSQKEFDPSKNG